MSIYDNKVRDGNFTSSEIVALLSEPTAAEKKNGAIFGKKALTYIAEKNMERRLQRPLECEVNARSLTWGSHCEQIAFNQDEIGLEYRFSADTTDDHPTIPYWKGSKDGEKLDEGKTVIDFKCPSTLKSFCNLVQPLYDGLVGIDAMNAIRELHKDGEKFYWQLVSNACIIGAKYAELIVFIPYYSQLQELKQMAEGDADKGWIFWAKENDLPFIKDGGYYKNINIIRFEVPLADKDLLTKRVIEAGKLLIPRSPSIIAAEEAEHGVIMVEDIRPKLKLVPAN